MTDAEITGLFPNSSYTVQLFSNDPTPQLMATYTEVVIAPPVLNLALPLLAFPTITNRQSLAGIIAATLTPNWQIPAGLFGNSLSVSVFQNVQNGQNSTVRVDVRTNGTATSGTSTLVVTAPATGSWTDGQYFISTNDQHGGVVSTNYQ